MGTLERKSKKNNRACKRNFKEEELNWISQRTKPYVFVSGIHNNKNKNERKKRKDNGLKKCNERIKKYWKEAKKKSLWHKPVSRFSESEK